MTYVKKIKMKQKFDAMWFYCKTTFRKE